MYKRQVLGQGGAAAQEQCTASLGALLQALMAQGVIGPTQPDALARMLHGGLADSALWIAGDDSQARLAQALQALDLLLAGLRRT